MKKETRLETTRTPDGKTLALFERDGVYAIRLDGQELMSTRRHASEEKLAELTCAPLAGEKRPRVLIGGLGLGFTLKAALAILPKKAEVVVVELLDAVVEWNRNLAYPLAGMALRDPRVEVRRQDVADTLSEGGTYDAILLDVDNGAEAFTARRNRGLYEKAGVAAAKKALAPGERLAYWSSVDDPAFAKLLQSSGFHVEVHRSRAHPTSGPWHTLFLARVSK